MDIFYNKTVTIYNKIEEDYREIYYPTVLNGVRLLIGKAASFGEKGVEGSDNALLSIKNNSDLEKPYLPEKKWKKEAQREEFFTLKEGDFFVEGNTEEEDTNIENFFEHMKADYDNVFQITKVQQYELIPHFEVGGK